MTAFKEFMYQTKETEIAEQIHDYVDELEDLLESCIFRPTLPERAIKSRALVYSEIPKLAEAIETLTQALVAASYKLSGQDKLSVIRSLEEVNMSLNELLPNRKKLSVVD